MPSRNLVRAYASDSYYHIYNRGVNKRKIFLDSDDFAVFLNLLKRYLDSKPTKDNKGREYEWLHRRIELLAFCLLPNHFHLLIYQHDPKAVTRLMVGVLTSYTGYFNKKYKRLGPLFQSAYKASRINNEEYLMHISRYIHLNPTEYKSWEFSSLSYFLGNKQAGWVSPQRVLDMFEKEEYPGFLKDYEGYKKTLDEIKRELANDI